MTTSPEPLTGPSPGHALLLDDVSVAFGREVVLHGVTGAVERGGSLALIGPNGAGKTTLIRAVLGLVPLAAGHIEVLGAEPAAARQRVAYVPQADALDPQFPITVEQVVLMGRLRHVGWLRRPRSHDREVARAALERVRLTDRARDRFGLLSGGQRQRVLLARAIAQEADLLLLDEPFNGVDTTTTGLLLAVLGDLRERGTSLVLSTHDLSIAHLACDEACLLNRHQVAFGPIADALRPDRLRDTYGVAALLAGDSTIVTTK